MRTADRRLFVSAFTAQQLTERWSGPRPTDVVVHEGLTLPRGEVRPLEERGAAGDRPRQPPPAQADRGRTPPPRRRPGGAGRGRPGGGGRSTPCRRGADGAPLGRRPGPLSGDDLADLIATSRLLVYPSAYEGFGLPPIEAYALGTPAVYRVTGAAREVLPDVPGGFDDEDPERFAAAAEEALALDDERLAAISAQMWERFDWSVVATRVAAALREDAG
ncbi:MAG: glycosyltransferase [Acidimicrobiia bacterium]|nr:glycosyltransferase [Acidimicrobiia bacterium]